MWSVIDAVFLHVAAALVFVTPIVIWVYDRWGTRSAVPQAWLVGNVADEPCTGPGLLSNNLGARFWHNEHTVVERYCRMAGWFGCQTDEAEQTRQHDRLLHAENYIQMWRGSEIANPILIMKFAVNVCGLSIEKANRCAQAIVRQQGSYTIAQDATVSLVMRDLLEDNDIFDAVQIVRFLVDASDGRDRDFWWSVDCKLRNHAVLLH